MVKLAASHTAEKGKPDATFGVVKIAKDAIKRLGKGKVVDATIGVLNDDKGEFAVFSAVDEHYRKMSSVELMDYASPGGIPEFQRAAINFTFQGYQPSGTYVKAVATPGGTGAVRNVVFNYLEKGEKLLIPDWCWGPYRDIASENQLKYENYEMFDGNLQFSLSSIKDKSREILKSQDSLVVIFNTPAHNPSGYSMTNEDWQEVVNFYKDCSENKSKKIIIILDMAYIDFAGPSNEVRNFMKYFGSLPENILVTIAFSMSKSFLIYGMRSGAAICLTSSEEVAEEFERVNTFTNRATWSNGSRGAQKLLADIMEDPEKCKRVDLEREAFSRMLKNRADIFLKESKEVGLPALPYNSGFFITVPADNPVGLMKKFIEANIHIIPLEKGIRFAISAVPTYQIPNLAARAKKVIDSINI